jgi:hypothetical protein
MSTPPTDDDERISRKVVYEQTETSGSSRSMVVTILVIAVIAIALIGYILLHMHR